MEPLLDIRELTTQFKTVHGTFLAVDHLNMQVGVRETFGLVGESGCGKSVTSLSIMRLITSPPGKITSGTIQFKGQDLLMFSEKRMRLIRGNEISMIFQEPMSSLNPVFTIGDQISEALLTHQKLDRRSALQKAIDMLKIVSIPDAEHRVHDYPHRLSGGMRQRVMIAMALICRPSLLIADEPTTALDVTIQAQILDVLNQLKANFNLSMLLITHDLGIIAETADKVGVMYAGKIVESGKVTDIFTSPLHPYTQGLLRSIPRIDRVQSTAHRKKLPTIEGAVPSLANLPPGCAFAPRCPYVLPACKDPQRMILTEPSSGHVVRCLLHQK